MFTKKIDKNMKEYILRNFRTNPDRELINVRNTLMRDVLSNDKKKNESIVLVLKDIIKDQIPAKLKFYSLLLLKELLESRNKIFFESFQKNLLERLATIANFPKDPSQCLDFYYTNNSEENKNFSIMFY